MKLTIPNFVTAKIGRHKIRNGRLLHIKDRSSCLFRAPDRTGKSGDSPEILYQQPFTVQLKSNLWCLSLFQSSSQQKKEAKLAQILILIVFFFLFFNLCKVALTVQDLGSLSKLRKCQENKLQFKSPLWATIMISVNHLFLVMNASANIFLFMVTGTQVTMAFFMCSMLTESVNIFY